MTSFRCAELNLTDTQSGVLAERLGEVISSGQDFESFRGRVAEVWSQASPPELDQLLSGMKHRSAPASAALLGNAPLPSFLPPTPSTEVNAAPGYLISTAFLVGCGLGLGHIYAFTAERDGALVHDIVSVPGKADSLSSSGSRVALDLHSEVAFHPQQPDFVLLSCLRNLPTGAATLVADASSCVAGMLESDIRQLERSVFEFQQPQSFAPVGRQPRPVTLPVAVRRAYGWDVRINCNSGHTVAADHAAAAALARLMENLRAASRTIQLSPGQVLILDNKRSVHGRESYDTDFGGSNRWLQRIYIRSIVGPELPDRPT